MSLHRSCPSPRMPHLRTFLRRTPSRLGAVLAAAALFPALFPAICPFPGPGRGLLAGQEPFTVDDLLGQVTPRGVALSPDGSTLVVAEASLRDRLGIDNHRFGDPTYVAPSVAAVWLVDTRTGEREPLFSGLRQVGEMAWSPDGSRLAWFTWNGSRWELSIRDGEGRGRTRTVDAPRGWSFAGAGGVGLTWAPDGSTLFVGSRTVAWEEAAAARFQELVRGPVTVLSSEEPFLAWEELRRRPMQQAVLAVDPVRGEAREALSEAMVGSIRVADGLPGLVVYRDITTKTGYDRIGARDYRVEWIPAAGGEPTVLVADTKDGNPIWSGDGRTFALAREGEILVATVEDPEPRSLTPREDSAGVEGAAPEAVRGASPGDTTGPLRFTPLRLSQDGSRLVASARNGLWLLDTRTGDLTAVVATDPDDDRSPRTSVVGWSPDGRLLYLTHTSRVEWDRGLFRHDLSTGEVEWLVRDGRLYGGWDLSRDGSTLVFAAGPGNRPQDLYARSVAGEEARRLTDSNPWMARRALGETRLIPYRDVDGRELFGVLNLPPDFQEETPVATAFLLYEEYFEDTFSGAIALLNAAGYAVMRPSVRLEQGYPGESWLKGVTASANRLIDLGIADPDRLGVHGTSYGGYATNLLIGQTDRFKAAINVSGKVNMVSFYTDSPRLGVRNIHAPERSQDRIGGSLWEEPLKYLDHSAIMFADRIRTPLLLITGDQDHNVPARQAMEMFYALRRLDRTVEWVNYMNGGHGVPMSTEAEVRDYHDRILRWYDRYLKGDGVATTDWEQGDRMEQR